jgi:xanthine dehydrogenase molybdopterin-binding subunit B
MERNYQAIDSLRKAIIEFWERHDETIDMEMETIHFDDVIHHMYKAMEALIPNAYGFVIDYIEHYTTEELIFVDEKLEGKEFEVFAYDRTTGILRLDIGKEFQLFDIEEGNHRQIRETANEQ